MNCLRVSVVLLSVLALGCGDDKTAGGGGKSTNAAKRANAAAPDEGGKEQRAAFTVDDVKRIAATDIEGYARGPADVSRPHARWSYEREAKTEGGGTITAMVTVGTCKDPSLCFTLDPANKMNAMMVDQAREALAKRNMADPVIDLESVDLGDGRKAMSYYQRAYAETEKSKEGSHALRVRYHDGANGIQIEVTVSTGGPIESRESFEGAMTKDEGLEVVREIFAALGDDFG